jgi:hypothetical protein
MALEFVVYSLFLLIAGSHSLMFCFVFGKVNWLMTDYDFS